jgi:hypothetical protein
METGSLGTFVLSWSQTELDGQWSASLDAVKVGVSWNWTGEAVRVDGATDRFSTATALVDRDLRQRAAEGVRKLLAAVDPRLAVPAMSVDVDPGLSRNFTVTDGYRTWILTVIETAEGRPPLLMVIGDLPPRHMDLWVVNHAMDQGGPKRSEPGTSGVICFTPGTMILTEDGPQPVETIGEGTRVQTKDNGLQDVLWVGKRRVTGARLYVMPHLAPIRLREGALERDVPDSGLLVSPDHRLIVRGARARALFNCDEVLVAARDLVNDNSIHVDRTVREVTYVHMLLPAHEIVFANGVETESFHPASAALADMDPQQHEALMAQLPEGGADLQLYGSYARRVLSRSEAAVITHDAGPRGYL